MADPAPSGSVTHGLTRVVAAVIERDGQLLICQRPAHKRHGGLWEFPGGKLHSGEDLQAGAARELGEELGVTVQRVGRTLFSRQDPGSSFLIEFVEVAITGTPRPHEHIGLRWVTLEELRRYPLAPTDRYFVEQRLKGHA